MRKLPEIFLSIIFDKLYPYAVLFINFEKSFNAKNLNIWSKNKNNIIIKI